MAQGRAGVGGFVSLWLLLTFLWFAANSSLAPESLATGALISAALAYTFGRTGAWSGVALTPASVGALLRYLSVFAVELVRANVVMARHVFARRITVVPGVV